ncbi:MAG: acyl-CoA thioesterase/BAAT N-terminal domain-containing protein [Henriciella sp.]|nr:acyl-CoA thioesterase/BAAT N-terminal domain-containing protein [Henriciella sp.]
MTVSRESDLIDRPIAIRFDGLQPSILAIIQSEMVDSLGVAWRAYAAYQVDADGVLDLEQASPVFGSFTEPGTAGFFWSMTPKTNLDFSAFKEAGPPPYEAGIKRGHRFGLPELIDVKAIEVQFRVEQNGAAVLEAPLRLSFVPEDVRSTPVRVGRVRGVLFEPEGAKGLPGVIQISGSGGGIYREDAALLASHGFSVLALGYFNYDDLSKHQMGVPIEYFEEAIYWFRSHLGHDRIGITGPSKGGEGSFVVAANLPDMIKAAVPIVPGDLYLCAADENGIPNAAWTRDGKPLPWAGTLEDWEMVPEPLRVPKERVLFNARMNLEPFYQDEEVYKRAAISVEKMQCPILIIWGEDDQAWPSSMAVERLIKRLNAHCYKYPVESYGEQGAGHFFTFPGFPTSLSDSILHSLLPIYMTMGGTPAATARLQRNGWRKMIDFFHEHLAA